MNEKSNSIINSLKRLERAGAENSRTTEKLKEACAEVACQIKKEIKNSGAYDLNLSYENSYLLVCIAKGKEKKDNLDIAVYECNGEEFIHICYLDEFREFKIGYPKNYSLCDADYITRERAIRFSKDVSGGLLDEISKEIEKRKIESEEATEILKNAEI